MKDIYFYMKKYEKEENCISINIFNYLFLKLIKNENFVNDDNIIPILNNNVNSKYDGINLAIKNLNINQIKKFYELFKVNFETFEINILDTSSNIYENYINLNEISFK